jgi:exo-1,4-beta-D-glucosaminidase
VQTLARHAVICLNDEWSVQSSAKLAATGAELSKPGSKADGWYRATLPATVLGTLVDAGVYPDPFVGMNLRDIPGHGPFAQNFSNHEMPGESPFAVSWWFRREFKVPKGADRVVLRFDGINYRANLWVNGQLVADDKHITGAYRGFEFDISERVDRSGVNVMALEIEAPTSCELALTWVDWNPSPPDKNMGIWKDVWLCTSGPVGLRAPHVTTRLVGHERAELTVGGDLVNLTSKKQVAAVRGRFDGRVFTARFALEPGERRRFDIDADMCPELGVDEPRLWWPRVLGEPHLYDLELDVTVSDELSDAAKFAFGIREITSELNAEGWAQFYVNGTPLVIRGAGWAGDLFLRRDAARDEAQLEYVKAMNLNTVRFEGMLERSEFLDKCDRDGILVIAGFCCCDCWEKWDKWGPENHFVAGESLRTQLRHARRHPSLVAWWYGSDFPPPEPVEKLYLDVLREERWPNPHQSSAADKPTALTGRSGLKMLGPYEYVPPNYWLEDTLRGGAWGFATEICPGAAIPPIESIKKMIPKEHLWPVNEVWNYHAGGVDFHQVKIFTDALEGRYGAVDSPEALAQLAQLSCYEAQRAMFEAYVKARPKATGVIQWMLNNAWPSMIWHLYDYYLRAGGGFFGTQKACEPLHALYADDEQAVYVNNDTRKDVRSLRVTARIFDTSLRSLASLSATVDVGPHSCVSALKLPDRATLSDVYFLDLRLCDVEGRELGSNLYWLPKKLDVLDHEKNYWVHTPTAEYADLSALRRLEPADVELSASLVDERTLRLELTNPLARLAFFMQLRLADAQGDDILPALYSDNYLSLVPGESKVVAVRLPGEGAFLPAGARIELSGINVPRLTLPLDALLASDSRARAAQ